MSRRSIDAWFVLIIVTCGPASALAATTRYVDGSCGNNAWAGTSPVCAAPDGPKATIQAGINASAQGDEVIVAPATYPEKITFADASIAVRSAAGPQATIVDGQGTGTVVTIGSGHGPDTVLEGFTITGGFVTGHGGGMVNYSSPTIRNCVFTGNQAGVASCIRSFEGDPLVEGCAFFGNSTVADGTVANSYGLPVYRDCLFKDNVGNFINFTYEQAGTRIINCRFINNTAHIGGGAVDGASAQWINCVFSRNQASGPVIGSFAVASDSTLVNCTISKSVGNGIVVNATQADLVMANCVIWESSLDSIAIVGGPAPTVSFSDIEGGWSGTGNIDADPLFVQPGTDALRLSFGSLCVNAGSNAALPTDALDLDGDGDTAEPIPFDLAGAVRVQDGTVDMGASEGQFAPGAPASSEGDVDEGEFVVLVPEGGPLDPLSSPAVILTNVSGSNNGEATVTQIDGAIYPGAGGYSDLGSVLVLETSIQGGHFLATVLVPFDAIALGGAAPQQVRATWYDASAGNWALAVWGDVNDSPGFPGAIGQRIYAEAPSPWGLTQEAGDYGVFWDPKKSKGFAWANVDHASDFGVGVSSCPGDCLQTPDGKVSVVDLLRLIGDWGSTAGGPCDVDADGVIGAADLAALLGTWGPCTVPALSAPGTPGRLLSASAAPAGSADLDADGAVDRADLELLQSCWGAQEPGCPADLDGDGAVGARDYLHLLAHWGPVDAAP